MDTNLRSRIDMKSGKLPIFMWDTVEIADSQVEYLMEEYEMSKDEAWNDIQDDYLFWEQEWEFLCEEVRQWMEENNLHHFHVTGSNMTWRNVHGENTFVADTGKDFIKQVVGLNCEYTLYLYEHGEPGDDGYHLYGSVSHHDSPTGEGRTVYPVDACWICGEAIAPYEEKVEVDIQGGMRICHKECYQSAWEEEIWFRWQSELSYFDVGRGDLEELYDAGMKVGNDLRSFRHVLGISEGDWERMENEDI